MRRSSESDVRGSGGERPLGSLLVAHGERLRRWVERSGAGLLRYESIDDLVQGIHLRALRFEDRFAYCGKGQFIRWIGRVARQHLADRGRYWRAMQRDAGRMLRITGERSTAREGAGGVDPAASRTGPVTAAARRELLELAAKALPVLFPRDRELVGWIAEDLKIEEIARRLGVSYETAKKARLRAIERFRMTIDAVARGGARGPERRAKG